jgi:hypothetical protein
MSAERPGPTPEDETTREVSATNNGAEASTNGQANGKLPRMWEAPAHFVLPSFEEALTLPAEERVDAATLIKKYRPRPKRD